MRISMRAVFGTIALIVAISSVALPAATAMGSTISVASHVNTSYNKQLRTRMSLNGYDVVSTHVKCVPAYDGTSGYVCQGQFVIYSQGLHVMFDQMIKSDASGYVWHTSGRPWTVRHW